MMTSCMTFLLLTIMIMVMAVAADTTTRITAKKDDDTPNGRLLAACMSPRGEDSVEDVQKALEDKESSDINVVDERSGQTPIMAASLRGKINIVKYLLQQGADTSIGERQGYTPQHGAGFQGRADVMEVLYNAGIDVNHVHEDGFTPLHRACWGPQPNHMETVKFLIEKAGVDVNLRGVGDQKKTCMQMTKNEETKELLRKHGAIEEPEESGEEL
mmetsp:Transcript_24439/g.34437  ORF Transcript_24439/g.34437 Transcript_24439/m.34437 type:complete len:215 (-) Transcript_24439:135-779(-)